MSDVTAVPLRPVGKGGLTALWIGIVVLLAGGIGGAWAASQKPAMVAMSPVDFMIANGKRRAVLVTDTGLQYQVLKPGSGPTPGINDVVQIDYRGMLNNGVEFDASKPGEPVVLPVAGVVAGFGEALTLMSRGAKYRVWIPPQLGYGDRAVGPIPANSVLVFDITMHDFGTQQQQVPQEGLSQQEAAPQGDAAPQDAVGGTAAPAPATPGQ